MTLLIAVFAAIISTIAWYICLEKKNNYQLGFLSLMYWGASLMWFVDAVVEYIEEGAEYFNQAPLDMLNDAYLGLVVVAIGLIIWVVTLIVKDPKGLIKNRILSSRK